MEETEGSLWPAANENLRSSVQLPASSLFHQRLCEPAENRSSPSLPSSKPAASLQLWEILSQGCTSAGTTECCREMCRLLCYWDLQLAVKAIEGGWCMCSAWLCCCCWLVPLHSTSVIKRSWAFSFKSPRIEPNYQYLIKPPRGFQPAVVHEYCHLNQLFSTFSGCVNNMWSLDHEDPDPGRLELCVLNHLPVHLCLSHTHHTLKSKNSVLSTFLLFHPWGTQEKCLSIPWRMFESLYFLA